VGTAVKSLPDGMEKKQDPQQLKRSFETARGDPLQFAAYSLISIKKADLRPLSVIK